MSLLIENPSQRPKGVSGTVIKRILQFLLLVVFVAGIVKVYIVFNKPAEPLSEDAQRLQMLHDLYAQEGVPASPETKDPLNYGLEETLNAEEISGHIIFTGSPHGENVLNKVYSLNVGKRAASPSLLIPAYIQYSAFFEAEDRTAPEEFFADSSYSSFSESNNDDAMQSHSIQRYDFDDGSIRSYDSIKGFYAQNMAWLKSDSKEMLAYSRVANKPKDYLDLLSIDSWEVVVTDLRTDSVLVVLQGAVQPKWSPDGSKLLVLRSDGMYLFDLNEMTEVRVIEPQTGKFLATSMFDISPDGQYLAWSFAKAGIITMHVITSWAPFASTEFGRIHHEGTEYYWPQFSPDGKFYAVEAIDAAKTGSVVRENPRIEIRSTPGREILKKYSLDGFDFNALFIDTWIQHISSEIFP